MIDFIGLSIRINRTLRMGGSNLDIYCNGLVTNMCMIGKDQSLCMFVYLTSKCIYECACHHDTCSVCVCVFHVKHACVVGGRGLMIMHIASVQGVIMYVCLC